MAAVVVSNAFEVTDRVRRLQQAAAERGTCPAPVFRVENQTKAYFEVYKDLPLKERQARSFAYALINEPVRLYPCERINGTATITTDPQWDCEDWGEHCVTGAASRREHEEMPDFQQFEEPSSVDGKRSFIINPGGIPGHVAWNYDLILSEGVEGLIERHRDAMVRTKDDEARAYHDGVIICLEAVLEWNRRHVAELRRMLDQAETPEERTFIEHNIRVMERVPAKPARCFHEALQSFHFQWECVMYEAPYGGNSPGRLDYFLWPYLQEEYESGELSYQDAAELVAELFIKMDEPVHLLDGSVRTIVVGGMKPDGSDAVNPLSTMMLDVFEKLDITHPAVYARIAEPNASEYIGRCVDYLLTSGNRAQILVDENIISAMTHEGRMPFEDAAQYMCGGCMEIAPHGQNSDLLFAFFYNVPKTLELIMTGGQCLVTGEQRLPQSPPLSEFDAFDAFYEAFETQVRQTLHTKFRCLDIWSEEMARCRPTFLQSSMIDDCLEKGRSQQDGGARYPDYGGTPLGIQNAADSLFAVKKAVFDEGFCTADELIDALRVDFMGHDVLHRRLLAIPKYGMGDKEADNMMGRVLTSICTVCDAYENRHGGRVKPVVLTFIWAPEMGMSLGASPDGRRAGQPVGHGLTPQGVGMKDGITTAINSYTGLPNELVSGGASTMWDMDHGWITRDALRAIVAAFARQGGQIFQGNMTDVDDLRKAIEHPEAHPNLFVRVGGFSARFVGLGRPLQEEIIERHRHHR